MASDRLDDLLIRAIEEIAELENFPSDWKNWAYWEDEKAHRLNNGFPSPHHLTNHIENIRDGRHGARSEVFVELLIETVFHSPDYGDIRNHPLWELALRIARHPNLKEKDRGEFFLYCSDEDLHLKVFLLKYLVLEKPDDGKVVEGEISVPENTEQLARKRANRFMGRASDQLAERFNFHRPYFYDLHETLGNEWNPEPQKNAPVRILSADRVK